MARQNKTRSRSSSKPVQPPVKQQSQQQTQQKPSIASGLGGALMTGMAFGAGSELMRSLFRSDGGINILPLLISGVSSYATYKLLSKNSYSQYYKYRVPGSVITFIGCYYLLSSRGTEQENI